jgi:hypothetical protein
MEKSLDDTMEFIENTLESGSKVSNHKSNPIGLLIRQDGSFYELDAAAEDQQFKPLVKDKVRKMILSSFHFDWLYMVLPEVAKVL